jgi:GrpB-like predicted nucleotidyltransferase (UPF0157 family)
LYFRRRNINSFNAHVVLVGGAHWKANLALRDLLRDEPVEREHYEQAKISAVRAGHTMLLAYSDAKMSVIAELTARAAQRRS